MNVKLIALDMDGTTLNSNGFMSDLTVNTINKAHDNNIIVSLATGRTLSEIGIVTESLKNSINYAICSNGALVYDLNNNKPIYKNLLSIQSLKKIYDILQPFDVLMDAYIDGKAYSKNYSKEKLKLFGIPEKYIDLLLKNRQPVSDLKTFIFKSNKPIEKLNIRLSSSEETKKVWHLLNKLPEIAVATSGFDGIEVNNKSANKADGLKNLIQYLKIDQANTMAIGDSINDKEMLSFVNISVAMGNAHPDIKSICKFITSSNDADGVAKAIQKYALKIY